jgi:hypothetical protein
MRFVERHSLPGIHRYSCDAKLENGILGNVQKSGAGDRQMNDLTLKR